MMKKHAIILLLILISVFFFNCRIETDFNTDMVLSLGRIDPSDPVSGTEIYAGAGGTLAIPVSVSTQSGTASSASFDVVFTLSLDALLETEYDNSVLGTEELTIDTEHLVELTAPSDIVLGAYTLFAVIQDSEDLITNNDTASISVQIQANEVNLEIVQLQVTTDNLPGAEAPVYYEIENTGYKIISADTSIVLDFTVNLSGVDTEIGSVTVSSEGDLYPLGSIVGSTVITMPTAAQMAADAGVSEADLVSWSGNLTVEVDPDNSIAESNETDNVFTPAPVLNARIERADLELTEILTLSNMAIKGASASIGVKLTNLGIVDASGYQVDLWIDTDTDAAYTEGTDVNLHSFTSPPDVSWITGDNVVYLNTPETIVIPETLADGNLDLYAEIGGDISELDTTNNSAMVTLNFTEPVPDLEVVSVNSDLAEAPLGQGADFSVSISNAGAASISGYTVRIYIDADADSTYTSEGDILLHTWETPPELSYITGLNETTLYLPTTVVLPESDTLAVGNYNIIADIQGATEDVNTANDSGLLNMDFVEYLPDLSVNRLTWTPDADSMANIDDPMDFDVRLENLGTAPASGYQIDIWVDLNADGLNDTATSDLLLYSFTSPADIAVGDVVTLEVPVTELFPSTIQNGNYDVYAEISGTMEELDTTNNSASKAVDFEVLKPDLSVASVTITFTDYVTEGDGVTAEVLVENVGSADAPGGEYSVELLVDADDNGIGGSDVTVYTWPTSVDIAEAGSSTYTLAAEVNWPTGIADGAHDVFAEISGTIDEGATNNNSDSTPVTFLSTFVDLSITYMATTDLTDLLPHDAGTSVGLTLDVDNLSSSELTTDFDIDFYLTADAVTEPASDTKLETLSVTDAIAGSGSVTLTHSVTVPAGSAGFYTLYTVVDSGGAVEETDETNNAPADGDECYVFLPVSDGTTSIPVQVMMLMPTGAPAVTANFYMAFHPTLWNAITNAPGGPANRTTLDGAFALADDYVISASTVMTYDPAVAVGFEVTSLTASVGFPYAFRLLPDYITGLPVGITQGFPTALADNAADPFEANDTDAAAEDLKNGGTPKNPLIEYVNAYVLDDTDSDFYTY